MKKIVLLLPLLVSPALPPGAHATHLCVQAGPVGAPTHPCEIAGTHNCTATGLNGVRVVVCLPTP